MRFERIARIVDYDLTEAEIVKVTDDLVALVEEKLQCSQEHDTASKQHKAHIKSLEGEIALCLSVLKKKKRTEDRACEMEYDYADGVCRVFVLDEEGERLQKIEERELTEDEKQTEMQFTTNQEATDTAD
jgi:hypothetical protein